jgi:hypothetical protein
MLIYIDILNIFSKVEYCEVNKESSLQSANGTSNQRTLPKRGLNVQK